jgi:hypothetical protein
MYISNANANVNVRKWRPPKSKMSSINNSVDDDHHALRRQHPRDLDPGSDYLPTPQPQPRRPRGFAATAAAATTGPSAGAKGKKEREKEKERTKLRERHRRAITSRMLAGLRQYGNFPLPARADMNDVLAALAREAGWIVDTDGSTYRQSPPPSHLVCVTNFGLVFSFFPLSFFLWLCFTCGMFGCRENGKKFQVFEFLFLRKNVKWRVQVLSSKIML